MLFLLWVIAAVAADFNENMRISLTTEHVTGFMMICILQGKSQAQILADARNAMADKVLPENRMRDLLGTANAYGIVPQDISQSLTWRDQRFDIAKRLLGTYNNDPSVLSRVVAIDELTVLNGRLELIAASVKFRFAHIEFVKSGKAKKEDIVTFIRNLAGELRISKPIILWDNINIHKNPEVVMFLVNKGWEVWPHPPESSDMNPLDYYDFKRLKKVWKVKSDMSVDRAEQEVKAAVKDINTMSDLQGIIRLPDVWTALVHSEGLMTL